MHYTISLDPSLELVLSLTLLFVMESMLLNIRVCEGVSVIDK